MARISKDGVNKSQAIRDYRAANPKATPKLIIAGLKEEKGIEVTAGLISQVIYGPRAKGAKGKGKRGPGRPKGSVVAAAAAAPARAPKASLTADHLFEAKKLVDQLGGVAQARKALDALEQLR